MAIVLFFASDSNGVVFMACLCFLRKNYEQSQPNNKFSQRDPVGEFTYKLLKTTGNFDIDENGVGSVNTPFTT